MADSGSVEEGEGGEIVAEFQEVMKQWRRMCDKHTCSRNKEAFTGLPICPIAATHDGYPCDEDPIDWTEKATKQLEEIVMAWAAEHPVVYPTWEEWLVDNGVFASDDVRFHGDYRFYMNGRPMCNIPTEKIYSQIPADIAQKLGIEPKEG